MSQVICCLVGEIPFYYVCAQGEILSASEVEWDVTEGPDILRNQGKSTSLGTSLLYTCISQLKDGDAL